MKKIITLALTFMVLISLFACSSSPNEVYGYWKSEKKLDIWSGTPECFIISENSIEQDTKKYTNTTLANDNGIWVTNELEHIFGVPVKYGFKLIDKNTLEVFTVVDKKFEQRGIYKKTSEEDLKNIISSKQVKLKSHADPF